MTSKLTRERLEEIRDCCWMDDLGLSMYELSELASMALDAMDSEPVAEIVSIYGDPEAFGEREIRPLVGIQQMPYGTKLYRHAQPAPELKPVGYLFVSGQGAIAYSPTDWGMPGSKLAGQIFGDIDVESQPAPVVPDEVTAEDCPAFVKYEVTEVDEAWARGFNAGRAATLQASNCRENSSSSTNNFREMLETSTNSPVIPDTWIPVSERMPDDDDFVYIWPRPDFGVELHVGQYCECSPKGDGWYAQVYEQNYGIEWHPITVTHWMPLPNPPKEEK